MTTLLPIQPVNHRSPMWTEGGALLRAKGVHRPDPSDTRASATLAHALSIDTEEPSLSRPQETTSGNAIGSTDIPPSPDPFLSPKRRFDHQIFVSARNHCSMQIRV